MGVGRMLVPLRIALALVHDRKCSWSAGAQPDCPNTTSLGGKNAKEGILSRFLRTSHQRIETKSGRSYPPDRTLSVVDVLARDQGRTNLASPRISVGRFKGPSGYYLFVANCTWRDLVLGDEHAAVGLSKNAPDFRLGATLTVRAF